MKKSLLAFPIVILLAVGCNSTQVGSNKPPVISNMNPSSVSSKISTPSSTPENAPSGNLEGTFVNLNPELQHKEPNIQLSPTVGYIITTSILSNKKDRVVYAEISDCIKAQNQFNGSGQNRCDKWNFNILVKDLNKNNTATIFKYSSPDSSPLNNFSLIPTAFAGGCVVVPFPLAWSPNDIKIILEWGNPTSCGSGGAPKYLTYTINPDGSQLTSLATSDGLFYGNHGKIVYTNYSSKSPAVCGPGGDNNSGKVVVKEIETDKTDTLFESSNTLYGLTRISPDEKMLNYTVFENKLTGTQQSCGDVVLPGKQMQSVLP